MNINDKLKKYIDNNMNSTFVAFRKARYKVENECCMGSAVQLEDICERSSIATYIDDNKSDDKFQKLLFKYIDERNLKDSDVYNKVHIDRRLFSKIRNEDYHPSKETIILLGLALELNEKEIVNLLESASYSLPKNNIYDLIIRFCFVEGIYKIDKVNELLDSYDCKNFSY